MRDKRDIELEFKAGDLDYIDAIDDLIKIGVDKFVAEEIVAEWEGFSGEFIPKYPLGG